MHSKVHKYLDTNQVLVISAVYHRIQKVKLNNVMLNGVGIRALGHLAAQLFYGQVCTVVRSLFHFIREQTKGLEMISSGAFGICVVLCIRKTINTGALTV